MSLDIPQQVYTDLNGLNALKLQAKKDPDSALREVAKQFESIFTRMMLKSMRDTVPDDGLLGSEDSKFYQGMYDDQLAVQLTTGAGGGIGLADILVKQLDNRNLSGGRSLTAAPAESVNPLPASMVQMLQRPMAAMTSDLPVGTEFLQQTSEPSSASLPTELELLQQEYEAKKAALIASHEAVRSQTEQNGVSQKSDTKTEAGQIPTSFDSPKSFIQHLLPQATKAAKVLGVSPAVLVAQAALETGWGKYILKGRDGSSNNLFNIKADSRWEGDRVYKKTLEYQQGATYRERSAFRQYDSVEQSFQDYVQFIQNNPRYQKALQVADKPDQYLKALQSAGYATDPNYASKIKKIMRRPEFNDTANWHDNRIAEVSNPLIRGA